MSQCNTNRFRIREAVPAKDAAQVLAIYTPSVTHSVTSLEFDVPTEAEMKQRMQDTQRNFPWLICEEHNKNSETAQVAGYAYACRHRIRNGYQWSAEIGIYVSESYRKQGVGSILNKKLCSILSQQGYYQALAIIIGENETSIAFHKHLDFYFVSKWEKSANKFGKWHDVVWYAKQLQPNLSENPPVPVPYPQIKHQVQL